MLPRCTCLYIRSVGRVFLLSRFNWYWRFYVGYLWDKNWSGYVRVLGWLLCPFREGCLVIRDKDLCV